MIDLFAGFFVTYKYRKLGYSCNSTGEACASTDNATLLKWSCVWLSLDIENETLESNAILAQKWANDGLRGHFVLFSRQPHVYRWYIFRVYVKVISSITLEFPMCTTVSM